jgi:hypothetical protein
MKNLFTVFLVSAFSIIFLNNGYSQTLSHHAVLYPMQSGLSKALPNTAANSRSNSLFLNPGKNTPMLSPLVLPNDSSLFYVDTTDQTKLAVVLFPSSINIDTSATNPNAPPAPDTLTGYGEHFSSPYAATKTYLDSVQFLFAVTNVGTFNNNYLLIYSTKTKTANGLLFPGVGVDSVAIDPNSFTTQNIVSDPTMPTFYIETIHMNSKLVGSKDFFVNLQSAIDPTQSLLTTDAAQNQFLLYCDEQDYTTFNAKTMRGCAIAYDDSVKNNFDLYWAGITNTTHTTPFYSNFWIIAYVSDLPSDAVNDAPLTGNSLGQNYPNPFNPSTEIKYSLADEGKVSLKVYNALGVVVATLADDIEAAGEHQVNFYGDNLPSGTYFYTLKSGAFSATKRMVLSK